VVCSQVNGICHGTAQQHYSAKLHGKHGKMGRAVLPALHLLSRFIGLYVQEACTILCGSMLCFLPHKVYRSASNDWGDSTMLTSACKVSNTNSSVLPAGHGVCWACHQMPCQAATMMYWHCCQASGRPLCGPCRHWHRHTGWGGGQGEVCSVGLARSLRDVEKGCSHASCGC
jgi:hypothetical protein